MMHFSLSRASKMARLIIFVVHPQDPSEMAETTLPESSKNNYNKTLFFPPINSNTKYDGAEAYGSVNGYRYTNTITHDNQIL